MDIPTVSVKPQDVSVVICAYTEDRWKDLVDALESVLHQTSSPLEIIVVIDHNSQLLQRVETSIPYVTAVENQGRSGASDARNNGVATAKGAIVAFLDDDATASPDWLEHLCKGYENKRILGVGGATDADWQTHRPKWLPEEFDWVVSASYRGMPELPSYVRNVWANNMSVRRDVFLSIGGFRSGYGNATSKIPRRSPLLRSSVGDEETDLCIRARKHWPQGVWLYTPDARIRHKVPASRATWRYFLGRCYAEGLGKAQLVEFVGAKDGLAAEWQYVFQTLPRGILLAAADVLLRRDPAGLARAGAIVAGLAATTIGYLVGGVIKLFADNEESVREVDCIA